jgi:hypothetical protein
METVPETCSCPLNEAVFPYQTVCDGLKKVTATASTPDRSSDAVNVAITVAAFDPVLTVAGLKLNETSVGALVSLL